MFHGYPFVLIALGTSNCLFGTKTCEDDEDDFKDKVQHEYGGSQEQDEKDVSLHNSDTDSMESDVDEVDESVSEDEIETSGCETHSSDSGTDGDVEDGGEETGSDQSDKTGLREVWGLEEFCAAGRIYAVFVQKNISHINHNIQEYKCVLFCQVLHIVFEMPLV
jgi:hypothetical protein